MKTALITGVTGQDGLYLSELLHEKGYEVYGLIRGQNNPKLPALRRSHPYVKILSGNLLDLASLIRALAKAQPDEVYNLGAVSFVAYSWDNAELTSAVTGLGVLNMLEAVRFYSDDSGKDVRFYQASSSEMFGKVQDVPQRESTLLWPRSPYGVAKVYGHYMTINYRESYGMHASSGILFNHESPRRPESFVTRKITAAVARQNGYVGPMRTLPREVAESIYFDRYLVAPGYAPLVPIDAAVTEELFDTTVNMGPARPGRFFQLSINQLCGARLAVDGRVGPATIAAYTSCQQRLGAATLCVSMLDSLDAKQRAEYDRLVRVNAQLGAFHRGWIAHRIGNVDRAKCRVAR